MRRSFGVSALLSTSSRTVVYFARPAAGDSTAVLSGTADRSPAGAAQAAPATSVASGRRRTRERTGSAPEWVIRES